MHFHHRTAVLAALISALAVPAAAEVDLGLLSELDPPAPLASARAGASVALDGDYALLGAPGDSVRGTNAGAVHVWKRTGGVWAFDATIRPAGVVPGDAFGTSVALVDGAALIGAPGDDGIGVDAGAVYVYQRGTSDWGFQQVVRGTQCSAGDRFGESLAVDGGTAIVGAPYDDQLGNNAGAVYVLLRGVVVWGEQGRMTAPDGLQNDHFGASVAIADDLVVVGSPAADGLGVNSGAAYTFERTGNTWSAGVRLPDVGASWFDAFGSSLATDGVRIAVGAPEDDSIAVDGGGVWTFVHDGSDWQIEGALVADLDGDEMLGSSVALLGETLLVGASGDDYANSGDGSVFAAEWGGLSWVVADRTGDPSGLAADSLGSSIAASGDSLLVGADGADGGVVDSGSARLYSMTSDPIALVVCAGDGSGPACPCDNLGGPGEGCANSSGSGAWLVASGEPIVGGDTLQLVVLGGRTEATGVFLQGNTVLGTAFRDGLLCVANETERLEVVSLDTDGAGSTSVEISVEGSVTAGDTRIYQFWYRDAGTGPCSTGSNLSSALQIQWQ